jgi:hypothetical protein
MVVKALSAVCGLTAAALLTAGAAFADPVVLGHNEQQDVNGVTVGCSGVGQSRNDPKWNAFPVRVVFAKSNGNLIADVEATLSKAGGEQVADVACKGSWVLFKVPAGRYTVEGRLKNSAAKAQTSTFTAPGHVTLRFPDAEAAR